MIVFPNCKINLGLNILDKREDGFHNLQSIFIPVQLCDALEIIESEKDELFIHGKKVEGELKENSCFKALNILRSVRKFPPVQIHLLKNIPTGAGLGGGSADGAFTLKLLNEKFTLGFSENDLKKFALSIGSDCAFFIYNQPMLVEGRGEKISPLNISMKDLQIAIIFQDIHIDTALAYRLLTEFRMKNISNQVKFSTEKSILNNPDDWKNVFFNDFEKVIFPLYPEIKKCKDDFYQSGALFSLMSGSGSAVYAFYKKSRFFDKTKTDFFKEKKIFIKDL